MTRLVATVLLIGAILTAYGCSLLSSIGPAAQLIKTGEIQDVAIPIIDRHDTYADLDQTAEPHEVDLWITQSALLAEALMDSETISPEVLEALFSELGQRHDEWVEQDPTLPAYKTRTYLRSTTIIRDLYSK